MKRYIAAAIIAATVMFGSAQASTYNCNANPIGEISSEMSSIQKLGDDVVTTEVAKSAAKVVANLEEIPFKIAGHAKQCPQGGFMLLGYAMFSPLFEEMKAAFKIVAASEGVKIEKVKKDIEPHVERIQSFADKWNAKAK
jgi:hypothetical protein